MARPGLARLGRQGVVWRRQAGLGRVWLRWARLGRYGVAWRGAAWPGMAGMAVEAEDYQAGDAVGRSEAQVIEK